MATTRVVTVAGDVEAEAAVSASLGRIGQAELVLRCVDKAELLGAARGARVDVVVFVGVPPWLDAHAIAACTDQVERVLAVVANPLDAETYRGFGIELADPSTPIEDLVTARPHVEPAVEATPARKRRSHLIAVWGPKGAPGRTTVAIELAAEIAAVEPSTALLDGDTYGGDIAQMVAVVEELPTIVWAAQAASNGRLDEATITAMLRRISADGPVLFPGINRPELWSDITQHGWDRLLEVVTSIFDFTVADVGSGIEHDERFSHERDRLARRAIRAATSVVAVCRADPVGIKSFLWSMERLRELVDLDDVLVVANQVLSGDADEVRYVLKKHLGKKPVACIPARPADFRSAVDRGSPLRSMRPSSDVADAIRDVASALGARIPARGLLTRLGGRT